MGEGAPAKAGVLLVNTGSPDAPEAAAVRRYLARFLMDPRIVPMNRVGWWLILHLFILPRRGTASAAKYARIWTDEGSPFTVAHDRLRSGLQQLLTREGHAAEVRCAMSYSDPDVPHELAALRDAGCTRLTVLPLYPQSAYSTTGSVRDAVTAALAAMRWAAPFDFIDHYYDVPAYRQAIAGSIAQAGFGAHPDDRLLFSYHGIPTADVDAGDTYGAQTRETSEAVARSLGIDATRWAVGYHSRFDKGRAWLSPFTRAILEQWAAADGGRVFVVCPNFAVDCLETLYDIEFELKPHYLDCVRRAGREPRADEFTYVRCLDRSQAHVRVLAGVLDGHVDARNG